MAQKAITQYKKRAKYNLVVCDISGTPTGGVWESGAYIRPDQFYSELFISDINNFWYETNGDSKIIAFDDMLLETPSVDPQLLVSADKQKIQFYTTGLVIGSDCYLKAKKSLGF